MGFAEVSLCIFCVPGPRWAMSDKVCLLCMQICRLVCRAVYVSWRLNLNWEVLGSKKGSIFNPAIVPLPLRTQLLWACCLEAGVARSGSERAQRTSSARCGSLCLWSTLCSSHGEVANRWQHLTLIPNWLKTIACIFSPEVTQCLWRICIYLGLYSGYRHLSLSTCLRESSIGVQLHLSGIEIHRIMWHSYRGGAVNCGFSCIGPVRVSWQRGSVTVFQDWAEGDPGVTLQQICLGAEQGEGAGTLGWSVLSAGVSPRPGSRRWTMPVHCACLIDSGCSGTLPWVPSMGSLRARGISLMGRQELLWLQTLGQRAQNKRYNKSRLATYTVQRWGREGKGERR